MAKPKRGSIKVSAYEHLTAEWHKVLNGSRQPEDVSHGSKTRIWWLCAEGPDHI